MNFFIVHPNVIKNFKNIIQSTWDYIENLKSDKGDVEFKGKEQEKKDLLDLIPQLKIVGATWQDTYKANYDLALSNGFQNFTHPDQLKLNWTQGTQAVTGQQNSLMNYKVSLDALLNTLIQKGFLQKNDNK